MTRRETLVNLTTWEQDAQKYSPNAIRFLIGNKNDLIDQIEILQEEGEKFEPILGAFGGLKTSAKTGEGVEAAFHKIARIMYERKM